LVPRRPHTAALRESVRLPLAQGPPSEAQTRRPLRAGSALARVIFGGHDGCNVTASPGSVRRKIPRARRPPPPVAHGVSSQGDPVAPQARTPLPGRLQCADGPHASSLAVIRICRVPRRGGQGVEARQPALDVTHCTHVHAVPSSTWADTRVLLWLVPIPASAP